MQKFIVLYKCPVAVLEAWTSKPIEERQEEENKLHEEWMNWTTKYTDSILETSGAGKTSLVDKDGVKDSKNDIMMFSIVQAEDYNAATNMFVDHPHLSIPEATIEIMVANSMTA